MSTVREILRNRNTALWTIAPVASVHDARVMLSERNVGALVVSESDVVEGILSLAECNQRK